MKARLQPPPALLTPPPSPGTPVPGSRWLRNGRVVNTDLDRVQAWEHEGEFKLVFSEVWASDDGEYACQAGNVVGQATTTCRVRIGSEWGCCQFDS